MPLFSAAASVLLVIGKLVEPAAIAVAVGIVVTGLLLRYRSIHRLRDRHYKKMHGRLRRERRFARFWILVGLSAIAAVIVLPPLPAMIIGSGLTLALLLTGVASARRSAQIEERLHLSKANAAEECDYVRGLAETAASIPVIRAPEHLTRIAHYEVAPGEIGMLPFLALAVVAAAFFVYAGLALAVGVSEAVNDHPKSEAALGSFHGEAPASTTEAENDPVEPPRTYAEECRTLPDPLDIGHGLGQLFRHDGAFKAGCGTKPRRVRGTGTWVSAGICEGTTRSVAVAAPNERSAIVYGEAAQFAWEEAMAGNLLAAEAATTAGGEVDLIETRSGNYAFTRLDAEAGNVDPRSCADVTGTDRPFVRLSPQMTLLWLRLLEYRASWSWPSDVPATAVQAFAFIAYETHEVTASGECVRESDCRLFVDEEEWPGSSTSYVLLENLRPYMPQS